MDETTDHPRDVPPPGATGTGAGAPPGAAPTTRPPLRRTRTGGDRHVFGVAGGVARYFDLDPLLVRIGFVVLTISGIGAGVLLYILAAVFVPEEGDAAESAAESDRFFDRHWRTITIVVGAFLALAVLGVSAPFAWGSHDGPWGVLWLAFVVTIGLLVYREVQTQRTRRTDPAPAAPPAPYGATQYGSTQYGATQYGASTGPGAGSPAAAPDWFASYGELGGEARSESAAREPDSGLGLVTAGAAALVAGVLVALDRAGTFDVPVAVVLAASLAVVGAGLVVGSVFGRARGLIPVGVVLAAAVVVAGLDVPGNLSVGKVDWRPAVAADVRSEYLWGMGDAELDLRDLEPDSSVTTSVEVGVGELTVLVDEGATVLLDAHIGAGQIIWPGGNSDGINRSADEVLRPEPEAPDGPVVRIDARVGVGNVEVQRVAS